jgi:hypothetical protein
MTTLLCVSRKDFFIANWYPFVENIFSKFNKVRVTAYVLTHSMNTSREKDELDHLPSNGALGQEHTCGFHRLSQQADMGVPVSMQ